MLGRKFLLATLLLFAASPFIHRALAKSGAASTDSLQSQSQKKSASSAGQTVPVPSSGPIVIPPDAAKMPNPEKRTAKSLANGKQRYNIDCAMCHGTDGDGEGFLTKSMKLSTPDFRDPAALKSATDGALFWVIQHGEGPMLSEKGRASDKDIWDMVNYVRSFAERKTAAKSK